MTSMVEGGWGSFMFFVVVERDRGDASDMGTETAPKVQATDKGGG